MLKSTRNKVILIIGILFLTIGLGALSWQIDDQSNKGVLGTVSKVKLRMTPVKTPSQSPSNMAAATVSSCNFSDVLISHPQKIYILASCLANVMMGYSDGTFKPDSTVRKNELIQTISLGLSGGREVPQIWIPEHVPTYCDVPKDNQNYNNVEFLVSRKVLICSSPRACSSLKCNTRRFFNRFKRNKTPTTCGQTGCQLNITSYVTREQTALLLARAIAGGDSKVPAGPASPIFNDVTTTRSSYKYIEYLTKLGVVSGYPDGTFHPTEVIKRVHLAQWLAKGFDLVNTALVANINGTVTIGTGTRLANGYLVFNGEVIAKTDANGNYNISGLDTTIYEVEIFDSTGRLFESTDTNQHLISPTYGTNTFNFSSLVAQ